MEEILRTLNNYFYKFKEVGEFTISNNSIVVKAPYFEGQYIKLQGSTLNDGVHKVKSVDGRGNITIEGLVNEKFKGVIYSLAIPKTLIDLEPQIKAFREKNVPSVFTSESIPGGYSYTKATGKDGATLDWIGAFSSSLKPYKKMYSGERLVRSFDK